MEPPTTPPRLFAVAIRLVMLFAATLACAEQPPEQQPTPPPNVLIIMADDCTFSDLPLYGGENVETPNIDRLATEGLTFDRAFVSMSMCTPCRSELYTGLYPMRSGASWNHARTRAGTRSIVHHLGDAGYRVGLAGKVHVKPEEVYPFEMVDGFDRNCVRNPTQPCDFDPIGRFISGESDQPFALVVALVEPHVPWAMGDSSRFDPERLKLPAHIADTPRTRENFADYLAEIAFMDQQLGDVLATLDAAGKADDTLVIFTSEQGAQFPGCKWTNWQAGIRTALVVRWPGRVDGERRTDALVQYADVLPTLVDAAGIDVDTTAFDGSTFLPVLTGEMSDHRRYAYAMHNNLPEGPPYPIRSVHDGRYHYVRNLRPGLPYIEKHVMGRPDHTAYWNTWLFDSVEDLRTRKLVQRYMTRPEEHLYDTRHDPAEMNNLAEDPQLAEIKARLADELDRWMDQQSDPGAPLDTLKALRAANRGEHEY